MRKLQIGVIGSMADIKLESSLKKISREVGREIARNGAVLVFGFEGDFESLSSIAAEGAEEVGGQTLAFIWGSRKDVHRGVRSIQVITGQHRGGGREFSLILSCDVIICLSGGSGTLMEIAMAYQAGIPIIAIQDTGGWSEKLSGTFLDQRKRVKVLGVANAKEAVRLALALARKTHKYQHTR